MPTIRCSSPRPTLPPRSAVAAIALAALLLGTGCAAPTVRDDAAFELSENYADGISYTVRSGDRLGDIALEFTGDMALWKEIAASNGIDDPRSLRVGSVLRIPAELIPGHADELATRTAKGDEDERVAIREPEPVEQAPADARTAVTPGLAVRRAPPVELSPVDINRRFELSPIDERAVPGTPDDERGTRLDLLGVDPADNRRVKVLGSYFPKGVYAQPATYSKLLMRVAPGTLFELDAELGNWYGVVTSDGVGYLRDSDGRIVDGDGDGTRDGTRDGEHTASLGSTRG